MMNSEFIIMRSTNQVQHSCHSNCLEILIVHAPLLMIDCYGQVY